MYDVNYLKDFLEEKKEDTELKNYLTKICKIFGEDYATTILSSDYDIKRSINKFSSKFNDIDSIHIQSLLLQNAILSNGYYKNFINESIKKEEGYNLFSFIESNMHFRKELTRLLIRNSKTTNLKLFDKNNKNENEKEEVINNIKTIKHFERFYKTQEKLQTMTKRKKGNHY